MLNSPKYSSYTQLTGFVLFSRRLWFGFLTAPSRSRKRLSDAYSIRSAEYACGILHWLETAPTGLETAKLTPMVRFPNRTDRLESS